MAVLPVLAIVAFIIVFVLLGIYSYQQRQQRLAELRALANELGWQFDENSNYDYDDRFQQFSQFCQGSGRYAYDTLSGQLAVGDELWPARMGDYHYETTSTDSKGNTTTHNHHFSYVLIQVPYPSLPDLRIRREGIFDFVASAFGFDDIDFESSEFSRRFHVKSSNKKFAYDVITPAMMEFLLAADPPTAEIDRGWCLLTRSGTFSAAEFREALTWTVHFYRLWPRHLVADLRSR